jgi:hypothetical protein
MFQIPDCGALTADCVHYLNNDAIAGIAGGNCFGKLNVGKLSVDQARAIRDINYHYWTKTQLEQLDPKVFSVFENTLSLTADACSGISDKALSYIPSEGLDKFQKDCWANIPANSMLGLSSSQIPEIGSGGMRGFTEQQLKTLKPDLCPYFTGSQAFVLNGDACKGMSLECLQNFKLDTISSLVYTCFQNMPDSIFSSLSADHITHIGCVGFQGINAQKFANAIMNIGTSLVDSINYQKLVLTSRYTIDNFINSHWGTHDHLKEQDNRQLCDQKELSWLKVIYSKSSSASCLSSRNIFYEPLGNNSNLFSALRSGHAPHVPNSFFQSAPLMNQFSSSFLGALSGDQISNIQCGALYGFDYLESLNRFGPLQSISPLQLSAIFNDSYSHGHCSVIGNYSTYQRDFFYSTYCKDRTNCKNILNSGCKIYSGPDRPFDHKFSEADTNNVCFVNSDFKNFYTTVGSCSEHYKSEKKDGNIGMIVGVVLGTLAVLGLVGAFVYWYKKKQAAQFAGTYDETKPLVRP